MQAGDNQGRWYYDCFVSSTSMDLKERYRPAVRQAIETLSQHPIMMEDFGARDGMATPVSTVEVARADIFVLVLAWRYGHIPQDETRSVTHLEYLEAVRLNKPRLVFLAAAATEALDIPFPSAQRDTEYTAQLHAFRAEVERDRVAAYFTTPDDLKDAVLRALNEYLRLHPPSRRGPRDMPPLAHGFVGREHEVNRLLATLRTGQSTAISAAVQGMAGVGKSTLAAAVVRKLAEDPQTFPGGIAYIFCGEQREASGLLWVYDRLLDAWDAPLAPNQLAAAQDLAQALALRERALRERLRPVEGMAVAPALVLLDNVEEGLPLAEALALLGSLGVTALVTARHRPTVSGLTLLRLDVLDAPAALALFAARYQEAGGDWQDARDQEPAAQIVATLGRLPLAIELAAADAALEDQGVAALASQVATDARRLDLLADPTDPTRSVRYAFNQSYDRLTPPLQEAFAALGLPAGTDWPREVIERLLAGVLDRVPDAPTPTMALNALAARALVTLATEHDAGGDALAPRVRLHPLLRAYAGERYAALADERRAQILAALMVAVQMFTEAHQERTAIAFASLGAEETLIVDVLRTAADTHVVPEAVLATVGALQGYFFRGGHWALGKELGDYELTAAREVGDRFVESRALSDLGLLAKYQGKYAEATHFYEQALAVQREDGIRRHEGTTLTNLGALADNQGQYAEAATYYQEALVICREVGDRAGEGTILNNLGLLADNQGQYAEAADYYQQALAILREVGDRAGEGTTLGNLGASAYYQEQYAEAASYYEQALALARAVGDRAGEGARLNNLGELARNQGRYAEAAAYYQQALAIRREVGDRAGEAITLHNIGGVEQTIGRYDEAEQAYRASLAISTELGLEGDMQDEIQALARLASREDLAATVLPAAIALPSDADATAPVEEMSPVPAKPEEQPGWWRRTFGRRQR